MSRILYLGLDPDRFGREVYHYPVIRIQEYSLKQPSIRLALKSFVEYTHCLFTSRSSVRIVYDLLEQVGIDRKELKSKVLIAVGKATGEMLPGALVAEEETADGVVALLKRQVLDEAFIFYPHSALSRDVISNFLKASGCRYVDCPIYEPVFQTPLPIPNLEEFDEIVFTSPSTVDGFLKIFGEIPWKKTITAIGPITKEKLYSVYS